jgi:excisionase family DNA binding protein
MTYTDAAAELGVSKRTIRRWIDAGRIPVVVLSPRVKRLRRIDLRMLVHECMAPN